MKVNMGTWYRFIDKRGKKKECLQMKRQKIDNGKKLSNTSAPCLEHAEAKAKDEDKCCHPCLEKLTMWKSQIGS